MKYNKLVRDKIPEIIKKNGGTPKTHRASKHEFWDKLKKKLNEEIWEFQGNETIEELADIMEVIDTIHTFKKFGKKEILAIQQKKRAERGGFEKRIILEES